MSASQIQRTYKSALFLRAYRLLGFAVRLFTRPRIVDFDGIVLNVNYGGWSRYMVRRILSKDYERDERRIVREMLRPHDRVLEIGGGIGLIALTARMTVPDENILVIEANPDLIPQIESNFQLNDARIRIENAAIVSDQFQESVVNFHIHQDFWSSSLEKTALSRPVCVKAVRLRDVLSDFSPNVLIVDIEGAECEIFKNIHLQPLDLICIELHPHKTGPSSASALIQSLLNRGFEIDIGRSRDGVFVFYRRSRLPDQPNLALEADNCIGQLAHMQGAV